MHAMPCSRPPYHRCGVIRIDESEPGEHAQVEYSREAGEDVRRPLTRMLRGQTSGSA